MMNYSERSVVHPAPAGRDDSPGADGGEDGKQDGNAGGGDVRGDDQGGWMPDRLRVIPGLAWAACGLLLAAAR